MTPYLPTTALGSAVSPAVPDGLFAQGPTQVGEEIVLSYETPERLPAGKPIAEGPVWVDEIVYPGASYIAPHFESFKLQPGDYVVVRSPDASRSWVYQGSGKPGVPRGEGFWGIHIPGEVALVELYSEKDGSTSSYKIDKIARGFTEDELGFDPYAAPGSESLCGPDDSGWAKCYLSSPPNVYDRSRAVARLLLNGTGACTGWLIGSEGHLMTNEHCIGSSSTALNTDYELLAEGASCTTSCSSWFACPGTVVATSATLVQLDVNLDFALVKLPTNPTGAYGYLTLRSSGASLGERIYIPQHPQAWGKKIAVNSTHPQNPTGYAEIDSLTEPRCGGTGSDVGYYADTQGGSSGSPVIGYSDHKVVALHHCQGAVGCTSTGGDDNRGVPIQQIISDLGSNLPKCAVNCACITAPANLTAWYPLDETSGTVANDIKNNHDGTRSGASFVAGKVSGAYDFDGVDDYVNVPDHNDLDFGTGNFTIDAWIKTTDTNGIIVGKRTYVGGTPQYLGYLFMVYNSRLLLQMADSTNGWYNYHDAAGPVINDGKWHLVAVSVTRTSSTGGRFYIDGNLVYTFNPTNRSASLSNASAMNIAKDPAGTSYFDGTIDEVEIFKRALTATEIQNIYAAQSAGKCKLTPLSVNLVCTSNISGSIHQCTATASGGSGPYSYTWSYSGDGTMTPSGNQATVSIPTCISSFNLITVRAFDALGSQALDSEALLCSGNCEMIAPCPI